MRWIRVIREIRVQKMRWCDESICDASAPLCVSVPLWFKCDGAMDPRNLRKSVFIRVQNCDVCDDFVCDAFVSWFLRGCDVCDAAMVR